LVHIVLVLGLSAAVLVLVLSAAVLVLDFATSGNEQKQGSSKKFRASHLGQGEHAIGFRFSVFEYEYEYEYEYEHEKSRGKGEQTFKLRHAQFPPFAPVGEKGRG
jgi:hypothetical protein